ncbi:MAG: hypothetical protein WBR18_02055 [Anaerolineales bacterium]
MIPQAFLILPGLLIVCGVFAYVALARPFRAVTVFLALLLLHEMLLRWLSNFGALEGSTLRLVSLWKEAALVGLLIGIAIGTWRSGRQIVIQAPDRALFVFLAVAAVSAAISPNRLPAVAALRDYGEPALLFIIGRLVLPSRSELRRWIWTWLLLLVAIGALGLWQGVAWDSADYVHYGFGDVSSQVGIPDVRLDGSMRIRPPSTVTGPNELALHMMLAAILSVSMLLMGLADQWVPIFALILSLGTLILTASRSGFLAVATAFPIVVWAKGQIPSARIGVWLDRSKLSVLIIGGLVIVIGFAWISGFAGHLFQTILDLPTEYHIIDTWGAVQYLSAHPAGVGMGMVGPRKGFGFPVVPLFHVEGSLFQIAMEMGIWGLAVFVVAVFLGIARVASNMRQIRSEGMQIITTLTIASWAGSLVAFLILPLMQALPLMAYLWFLLGFACSAKEIEASWTAGRRLSPQAAPTMPPPSG